MMAVTGLVTTALLLSLGVLACAPPVSAPPAAPARPAASAAATVDSGPSAAGAPAPLSPLHIAAVNPLAIYWSLYVAQELGLLAQQGINLEIVYTTSPPRSAQLLVAGEVELGTVGADTVVEAVLRGADLRIVAGGARNPNFRLATLPPLTRYEDLRGKTLAVIAPNLADAVFLKKLLERHNLRAEDYDLISIGGTAERYAALKAGAIAGTLLTQPLDFQAQDDGMNILGTSSEVVREYQFVTTTVRRDWAAQNHDLLVRYLKAIRAADQWLTDTRNQESAAAILVKYTNTRDDYARRTYELYYREANSMPEGAEVTAVGMDNVLQIMAEQGRLEPPLPSVDRFVDTRYWRAAAER
jgi:ABC-type nitrate/sulfonate/bicarbonate transport system substrate-binding protein